jgi:protein tyrosine phosphatase
LDLKEKIDKITKNGPIVIHCSAGVGRTGTYCCIDITLNQIDIHLKEKEKNDFLFEIQHNTKLLKNMRTGMIQTIEQYDFCYKFILEECLKKDFFIEIKKND